MHKFYTTTPIYYVNDVPHIGHTYTTVAADVVSRYYRGKGYSSYFLTGTDEHGAKITEAAKKHNETPQQYADQISAEFKKAWDSLNIDYSRFIRTTDPDHIKTVEEFLQKLYDNGGIDQKPRTYKGLYCVGHEKFMSPEELVDGLCPDHKTAPIEYSEENYYFKLSNYQKQLEKLISSDDIKIQPETRKNEILGKIRQGLEDISISRKNVEWGIPLPFDKTHTIYVWIDALINYYTYGKKENIWPADLHIVGKDILWFHAVIWPAMLLAIEEQTPKSIFAHGFFTIEGQKMSKTIGNVIKPESLIEKYGVDGTRYVLLAAFKFGEDGDFSWELFDRIYTADLANGLGNLVSRVAKLAENINLEITPTVEPLIAKDFDVALENLDFSEAISIARHYTAELDKKINEEKPWAIEDKEKLAEKLNYYINQIVHIGRTLRPFMPQTAEKVIKQFSGKVKSGEPLFPRLK